MKDVTVFKDFKNHFPFAAQEGMKGHFLTQGFFMGKDMREGQRYGNSSFFPADICTYGSMITHASDPNVYVGGVSPMDENGNFQIGLCNMWEKEPLDYVRSHGGKILLEVNPNLPRVRGGIEIHISEVTALFEAASCLPIVPSFEPSEQEKMVAQYVRSLLRDCLLYTSRCV